ncbi:MAG: 6-phosphogluconolactonase [Deltaproteobacteria bacterium]|nr:6-phosphogluconolactonase [Deltaproteobacteria bacterium]
MLDGKTIVVEADSTALAAKAAALFCRAAGASIARQGFFAAALCGGSTPRTLHRLFSAEPCRSDRLWMRTHLWWVDERMVPEDHPESNYGAAKEAFLKMVSIPADHVHPMPVSVTPEAGAHQYQEELKRFFDSHKRKRPVFDLILLGVGEEGHIASLFPGSSSLDERDEWVVSVKGGDPDLFRLTLTLPVLNQARHILFMVSGTRKAAAVKMIFQETDIVMPVHRIQPAKGSVTWLLDREAASLLS